MAAFLGYALCGLFAGGAFKIFRPGPGFYLRPPLEIFNHIPLFVDAIAGIELRRPPLPVFDFGNNLGGCPS